MPSRKPTPKKGAGKRPAPVVLPTIPVPKGYDSWVDVIHDVVTEEIRIAGVDDFDSYIYELETWHDQLIAQLTQVAGILTSQLQLRFDFTKAPRVPKGFAKRNPDRIRGTERGKRR